MKILSTQQVREADRYTIENEPVSSADLMERAAAACAQWILANEPDKAAYFIICGTGNNGGDGLAIARMLDSKGRKVKVSICGNAVNGSADFKINLERLKATGVEIVDGNAGPDKNEVVVDALFGTGLSRPLSGDLLNKVKEVNKSGSKVISIDIPSGMPGEDGSGYEPGGMVKADFTLTFQCPKLSMMLPGTGERCGRIVILDIGLHGKYLEEAATRYYFTTAADIHAIYEPRSKFSHKGSFGHAMLVCGSEGKYGAAVLAARACIHAGAGLTTLRIPSSGEAIMQSAVPEAMVSLDKSGDVIGTPFLAEKQDALGMGPGIGTSDATASVMKQLIQDHRMPMVFDADALNILGKNPTWLGFLPSQTILTPHVKEFARMFGEEKDPYRRLLLLQDKAVKTGAIIILKGAHTAVAMPDGSVHFNSTGNPGLAKGGSGDVLTGIITSLLAQGYVPPLAAVLGVYLHGLAADIAVRDTSEEALSPADVIACLGKAFREIRGDHFK